MTLRDVLWVMRRRWYVVTAAVLIMAALTLVLARDGGTFSTRTVVTFTYPAANALTPDGGTTNESIITFAGTVATQINRGRPAPRYSKGDAPFYGAGVREGVLVGLRDEGSQWGPSFGSAIIDIQIVGRSREWVDVKQTQVLDEIDRIATSAQTAGIAEDQRIAIHVEPLTKRIEHITASRTAQIAAGGAMLAVALLVGGWGAWRIDRWVDRRRRAPIRSGPVRYTEGVQA